ncbi:branched-chain amino acid ABC transporter permease [Skermanella aerolata]|uniref:Branched-chain amino acid ABC transporter permease n=1 Tax=Skermanella aerolata TaxID=393310 RepID=A0A512DXJ3_9PROT|nr:ABC transporter permease [Skermanella aerolata]KJB92228.1 ABC transporter permease [Skermanella aerolata KACC 11604]GEO41203.1 branched-chain amino acid ABC transporter permease [Skermanella aerolata]
MGFYVVQCLSGLAQASSLFLVAAGLSIIFGVTRIVNFAHGSFYMVGAYIAVTLAERWAGGFGFWGAVAIAAFGTGLLGVVLEMLVLRRLYRSPELFQLLATFGVVLIVQDAALAIWGPEDLLGPRAPGLEGVVRILGRPFPKYELLLIALGPLVLGLLWLLFNRTRWGTLVRAATQDREMTAALGINQTWLFTSVLFLGSLLAGLGGALQIPREAVNLHMDINIVVEAFVVVVVGGMGSVGGAFLAAVLIGQLQAFGILIFPQITLVIVFLFMAVVLVVRPHGLLGRPQALARAAGNQQEPLLRPATPAGRLVGAALLAVLALLPALAGDYALTVLTEILILTLFAASLHFIMGPGGMISFGHAAYFGLGAYGAGLLVKHFAAGMLPGLVAAPLLAAGGALLFGWFCVRLSGVYLAMLTLAFAQITWSVAFQWQAVTGGDNGILGVWPDGWASPRWVFYYLTLACCAGGVLMLRRIIFSPFGYALRAGRDSPLRADAVGIDVRRIQWLAFTLAGTFAGLGGGLYAYAKGSVFPNLMAIPRSVDALVMVLLGGVQTLTGPVVGAAVFHTLNTEMVRHTEYWRLLLGVSIIVLVLVFPMGIAGAFRRRERAA